MNQIHEEHPEIFAFTAVFAHGAGEVEVDEPIPQVAEISVNVVPISGINDTWIWKVEDGRVVYNPNYQGRFAPQWY